MRRTEKGEGGNEEDKEEDEGKEIIVLVAFIVIIVCKHLCCGCSLSIHVFYTLPWQGVVLSPCDGAGDVSQSPEGEMINIMEELKAWKLEHDKYVSILFSLSFFPEHLRLFLLLCQLLLVLLLCLLLIYQHQSSYDLC